MDAKAGGDLATADEQRFSYLPARLVGTVFFYLVFLVELPSVAADVDVAARCLALALVVASVPLGIRSFRHATVIVGPKQIVLRGLLRTRRAATRDISFATIGIGRTGMFAFDRQYVKLQRKDGRTLRFKELNSARPSYLGDDTLVSRAVAAINLAAARGGGGPPAGTR